jgi:hypothetical protein
MLDEGSYGVPGYDEGYYSIGVFLTSYWMGDGCWMREVMEFLEYDEGYYSIGVFLTSKFCYSYSYSYSEWVMDAG